MASAPSFTTTLMRRIFPPKRYHATLPLYHDGTHVWRYGSEQLPGMDALESFRPKGDYWQNQRPPRYQSRSTLGATLVWIFHPVAGLFEPSEHDELAELRPWVVRGVDDLIRRRDAVLEANRKQVGLDVPRMPDDLAPLVLPTWQWLTTIDARDRRTVAGPLGNVVPRATQADPRVIQNALRLRQDERDLRDVLLYMFVARDVAAFLNDAPDSPLHGVLDAAARVESVDYFGLYSFFAEAYTADVSHGVPIGEALLSACLALTAHEAHDRERTYDKLAQICIWLHRLKQYVARQREDMRLRFGGDAVDELRGHLEPALLLFRRA